MSNFKNGNANALCLSKIEWPTIGVAIITYVGWLLLTYYHLLIPDQILLVLGGACIALQSSLQHETMHGHPTRVRLINKLIGYPPLSLWLPYEIYRSTHMQHHINELLTDPLSDPESAYVSTETWISWPKWVRLLATANTTILGRLLIGPYLTVGRFWQAEFSALVNGDCAHLSIWVTHAFSVLMVVCWLTFCRFDLAHYFLLFLLPGTMLLSLRSFAEHRAEYTPNRRTAIVENASVLSLLFLNNNLHAVHHSYPYIPWYRLPEIYRQNRTELLSANNYLVYDGYAEVVMKYLYSKHDALIHPFAVSSK